MQRFASERPWHHPETADTVRAMTTTLTRPHNRLAPAAPQEHTLRDALLVTALALPTVVLATLGKPFMHIPGVVDGTAHAVRDVNLVPFTGFETASVWYGGWTDMFGNIALFVPLAAALCVATRGRLLPTVAASAALSMGIEATQYVFALGFSDVDDLIYNTVGAVIGALLMRRLSLDKCMKVLNRLGFVLAVAVVALGAAVLLT